MIKEKKKNSMVITKMRKKPIRNTYWLFSHFEIYFSSYIV